MKFAPQTIKLAERIQAAKLAGEKNAVDLVQKPPVAQNQKLDRLLRLPQVLTLIPISKSSWYAGIASGIYPKSIPIGGARAWRLSDIEKIVAKGAL